MELQSDRDRGPNAGGDPENVIGWPLLKHLVSDQKAFWTGWRNLDRGGALQFSFFAGFTGVLVASDHWLTQQLPASPTTLNRSDRVSQFATYSLLGAAGSAFLWGHITRNDHLREAGFLSGEAVLNSMATAYTFKAITQRQRPLEGNGSGQFFLGGSSFPSEHSAIAWSVASVVAHEYPGPLTKILAYGLASTVTLTRVTGKQHFSSDVFVGTALGWYLGRQVYRARHDPELGGGAWDGLLEATADAAPKAGREAVRDPKKNGFALRSRSIAGCTRHWSGWRRSVMCNPPISGCAPGLAWNVPGCSTKCRNASARTANCRTTCKIFIIRSAANSSRRRNGWKARRTWECASTRFMRGPPASRGRRSTTAIISARPSSTTWAVLTARA